MSNYTLHLGYTWDSPQIGAFWGTTPLSQRFLQLALADASGNAAPFQFKTFDSLSFELWDLTAGQQNKMTNYTASLNLSALDSTTIYPPSNYLTYSDVTPLPAGQPTYLALYSSNFIYKGVTSPCWGPARTNSLLLATVCFKAVAQLQLSLLVEIASGSEPSQQFLKTVEIVVSA